MDAVVLSESKSLVNTSERNYSVAGFLVGAAINEARLTPQLYLHLALALGTHEGAIQGFLIGLNTR